ncbi:MAG: hypothetical protein UEP78_00755 [Negativibacillus sp.]|nr:hypothetical protein [Negativibacillus sp.]
MKIGAHFFKTQQNIRTRPFLCKIKKDTLRVIPQNTLTQTTGQAPAKTAERGRKKRIDLCFDIDFFYLQSQMGIKRKQIPDRTPYATKMGSTDAVHQKGSFQNVYSISI